ncbi:MAG: hypothetical protein MZV63_06715 [Marinilabiliales bacterium]|nr:hypothetical protein [Marinilabiliales bacterium]
MELAAHNADHSQLLLGTGYSVGDSVLYFWKDGKRTLLYGKPLDERAEGEKVPLNGLVQPVFSPKW